ncbi:AAA family ATPase [Microbacterium lacus]|uniref:AAA family ATPase n=1 Tax=Microbacterium lacus TaxID=415217 RepID=UPI0031D4D389
MTRFVVDGGVISLDLLDEVQLRQWVDGRDPQTGELRGRNLSSPDADLLLDGTINAPKSYSIAALINADLADEFEALQDRLRDRIVLLWQAELNARRGAGGCFREALKRVEVVELRHARSRALDPHMHRHLWLNVKVLGEDGKWSNVDSRVAMKLHTVVNAEGELAARTDPGWIAALARHGYTLNEDGEIAEFAHVVRPLSRRSNQIERNRAVLLAQWYEANPGGEPSPDVMHQIDRRAWATGRPNKPGLIDEAGWEEMIRAELAAIDPHISAPRARAWRSGRSLNGVDRQVLAARAVVDADGRSTACGGRFSQFDLRAGAIRAVAGSGVVATREELQPLIDEVVLRALFLTEDLLPEVPDRPDHVKGYMASTTARMKVQLAARFDALSRKGTPASAGLVRAVGREILDPGVEMADRQVDAAAAIAGSDRLVSVTGPAGAGKTTMLRVAKTTLALEGRRIIVVAPTKKAASVAGREIGARASSLHALLADHGWRWGRDDAGAEVWHRLVQGETDEWTGEAYAGPRSFPLLPADRIVVDEAGMVDLHTGNALAELAELTGAGIAMVGDPLQAMPVGHRGAMAIMTRRSTATVELTAIHRFFDPSYADLTLRMREPRTREEALAAASELDARGQIRRVANHTEARDAMVDAYFQFAGRHSRVALVTSTNEEADAINDAIQQRRLDRGELGLTRIALGRQEQRLLEGDVVQTRLNDQQSGVENRAIWTVHRISAAGIDLVSVNNTGESSRVTHAYAADHLHLAYASTVHGIQGETTQASIVGPGVDAAGLYVGMTRGRFHNEAIAVASTDEAARAAVADAMRRGQPELSVEDSERAARAELDRAARPALPLWNDRVRRPLGRVVDIQQLATALQREASQAARQLARIDEWMGSTEGILLAADARIAGELTKARDGNAADGRRAEKVATLRARYVARHSEHFAFQRTLADLVEARDIADAEVLTRRLLTADAIASERSQREKSREASAHANSGEQIGIGR